MSLNWQAKSIQLILKEAKKPLTHKSLMSYVGTSKKVPSGIVRGLGAAYKGLKKGASVEKRSKSAVRIGHLIVAQGDAHPEQRSQLLKAMVAKADRIGKKKKRNTGPLNPDKLKGSDDDKGDKWKNEAATIQDKIQKLRDYLHNRKLKKRRALRSGNPPKKPWNIKKIRKDEVAPPGWGHTKAEKEKSKPSKPKSKIGGTIQAMKKAKAEGRMPGVDNIFALAWSMKNKGDKPHYKPGVRNVLKKKYTESRKTQKNCIRDFGDLKQKKGDKDHGQMKESLWEKRALNLIIAEGKRWDKVKKGLKNVRDYAKTPAGIANTLISTMAGGAIRLGLNQAGVTEPGEHLGAKAYKELKGKPPVTAPAATEKPKIGTARSLLKKVKGETRDKRAKEKLIRKR